MRRNAVVLARVFAGGVLLALATAPLHAQIAVSANDGKVRLVDGKVEVLKDGKDTIAFIDLTASPPKVVAEIEAPASVVGPPTSVAVAPNATFALVTGAMQVDPADPAKQIPDDKVTVIDLSPLKPPGVVTRIRQAAGIGKTEDGVPKVIATLQAGKGASGVSFNKGGTLALVANRSEGTVSVFTVEGKTLKPAGKVDFGNDKSGPSSVAFTPDGKTALVTLDGETANKIAVLSVDGTKVEYTKRDMNAGLRPYGMDISAQGDVAVVANIGRGQGDSDTISVIDLKAAPPRVVNTITVGQTPEGIKMSPDGRYVAVTVMNGTNKPASSPFHQANGLLQVYSRNGTRLTKAAEAPVGRWCQGAVWNTRSNVVLVQCMVEQEVIAFRFNGNRLDKAATLKVRGGPAGIRTAE